jgi:hypothetical protein
MQQIKFTPSLIVEIAEAAIMLNLNSLGQLLVDSAFAIANDEIRNEDIALSVERIRAVLVELGEEELRERHKRLFVLDDAAETIRLELMSARAAS